jgi:hypothetical protein
VLQDELAALRGPTGRIVVGTPEPDRVVALLDGRVEGRDGTTLTVRHPDPAELNAMLVGEGIRVTEIGLERRSLEQVVMESTTMSSDRVP